MKYRKVCFVVGLIGLSACDIGTPPEIKELRRLCALDAGQTVYETVQADGYFDATIDGAFIVSSLVAGAGAKFSYIEFCNDKTSFANSPGVKVGPGCWRATKVARDKGNCNVDADNQMKKWIASPYPEFMKTQCISVEKIDKPTARYWFKGNIEERSFSGSKKVTFIKAKDFVVDSVTGKNLAESTIYVMDYTGRDIGQVGCNSPEITGKSTNSSNRTKNIFIEAIKPLNK